MNLLKIEHAVQQNVTTGLWNSYYTLNIPGELMTMVEVEDFNLHHSVKEVLEYCIQNMYQRDAEIVKNNIKQNEVFHYLGWHHFILEMNVVLADSSQDRYKSLEDVAATLELYFIDTFENQIKLIGEIADNELGFTFTVDWANLDEFEDEYLKDVGFGEDACENTKLLIKHMNCSLRLLHNFEKLLEEKGY